MGDLIELIYQISMAKVCREAALGHEVEVIASEPISAIWCPLASFRGSNGDSKRAKLVSQLELGADPHVYELRVEGEGGGKVFCRRPDLVRHRRWMFHPPADWMKAKILDRIPVDSFRCRAGLCSVHAPVCRERWLLALLSANSVVGSRRHRRV